MKGRCTCVTDPKFASYGARGLKVDPAWINSFPTFLKEVGPAPSRRHTLGREKNNLGYVRGNVRWETPRQQSNNTRRNVRVRFEGKTLTIAQWAREKNIPYGTLQARITVRKWTPRKALTYAS